MSPYELAAAAAAAVLIVFLYVVKNRRRGKLPPSPPSLPLIGHLHLIGRLAHRSVHDLQLRYGGGGGLLFLQLGRRRTLVVSTAAAAAGLFRNHDLAFASRPRSVAAEKLTYGCSNVSFAPYGENWRRGKKIAVVHLLSPRRVESFAPVRAAEVAALVARTRRAAEAGEAVELRELLYGYTNAVITRAATGAAGATAEKMKQLMGNSEALMAGFQPEDVLPDTPARFVRWATGLDKKVNDMAEAWDKFLSEIVAAHKEKGDDGAGEEDEDFVDVLLRLREEGADGLELTDDRIKSTIEDIIAAATETSSQTLEWTMAELVANPRVMAKLQDEIARVATADQPAVAEPDLNKMEYLKAVFKEVLRLHAPAPLLVPHESTTPAVVQGYEIPAGTALFINAWAIGRDPAAWDAPEEFRPERFVGGGAPADFRGTDYQLIPFGAGRRICPGGEAGDFHVACSNSPPPPRAVDCSTREKSTGYSSCSSGMAAAVVLTPASPALRPSFRGPRDGRVRLSSRRPRYSSGSCRAMAQTFQGGPAASYAREMERLSAKESLLLAFKDAGGFEALVSGKTTEMQRIDVNERIVGLERLNPTPRPTTSPFLEGRWNFEWFGDSSPGAFAARLLFERSPTTVAHFMGLDVSIKDGYTKISSNLKFLNTIQSKFLLTTQLSVEGPVRMKEEYVEGLIEIPKISEETLPEQLKSLLGQTAGALQQLPSPIRDAVSEGLKLPLSGTFQRLFMISYLDEEILIIRDAAGAPDVLTRLEGPQPNPSDGAADAVISEYES